MISRRRGSSPALGAAAFFCAAGALLLLPFAAGCGGGGGDPVGVTLPASVVTRSNEQAYSEDAKILAARAAQGAWLSADEAARIDRELGRIRDANPAVRNIHARPAFQLHDLLVRVRTSASWRDRWRAGQVTTGQAALDGLLNEYGPSRVDAQPLIAGAEEEWFVLHFDQSLNMPKLAQLFAAASPDVTGANANQTLGDGDDITVSENAAGGRTYTFSVGWGDCQAGCISRHYWEFAVAADGTPTPLGERGDPLPTL